MSKRESQLREDVFQITCLHCSDALFFVLNDFILAHRGELIDQQPHGKTPWHVTMDSDRKWKGTSKLGFDDVLCPCWIVVGNH